MSPKRSAAGRNAAGCSSPPPSAGRMRTSSSLENSEPVARSMIGWENASVRPSLSAELIRPAHSMRSRRSLSRSRRSVTSVPIVHVSIG